MFFQDLGQILHGSITSDLSEPYGNLGKILVRSPWPNLGSITSDFLSEPHGNLDKILVGSPWPNLAQVFLHAGTSSDLTRFSSCFLARLYL